MILKMYKVIVPAKANLEIVTELEFLSKKSEAYTERVASEISFHLQNNLRTNPGFGAIKAKKAGLFYFLIQKQFKLVFEIDELNKQVILHYFFNTRKAISKYI